MSDDRKHRAFGDCDDVFAGIPIKAATRRQLAWCWILWRLRSKRVARIPGGYIKR